MTATSHSTVAAVGLDGRSTRPRSTRKPVTRAPSTTRTPRSAAALAVAKVAQPGLTVASSSKSTPPARSSTASSGETAAISSRRHLARRQAVVVRQGERVAQLGEALGRAGDGERAVGVVADVDAGERREVAVEVAAVARELGLHVGAAGAGHEPRGVPARAAGDPAALEDDGVGPAQPGQVERDGGADDAAADDDRPRPRGRSLGGPRIERRRGRRHVAQPLLRGHRPPSSRISVSGPYYPRAAAAKRRARRRMSRSGPR